jgi:chromosome segregation ATPase
MNSTEYQSLLEFLRERFGAIDQRFAIVDQRFEAIDQRFEAIDQRFEAIDQRFEAIDRRFATVEQSLEMVAQRVAPLDRQFVAIDQRFGAMERRFDALEGELREFRREVLGHFDEIYRRLDRLEQEYQAITQALRRIEALLADETRRRDIVEQSVADLKRQVAALQARIEQIERRLRG